MVDRGPERAHRYRLDTPDERRLARVLARDQDLRGTQRGERRDGRKYAAHRSHAAVERQLSHGGKRWPDGDGEPA